MDKTNEGIYKCLFFNKKGQPAAPWKLHLFLMKKNSGFIVSGLGFWFDKQIKQNKPDKCPKNMPGRQT